jgi:hypothetical protein
VEKFDWTEEELMELAQVKAAMLAAEVKEEKVLPRRRRRRKLHRRVKLKMAGYDD